MGMSKRVGSMSGEFVEMGDGWSGGKTYTVESTKVPCISIGQSTRQFLTPCMVMTYFSS